MPGNPHCPVLPVKIYLSKWIKQCQALWETPKHHKAIQFSLAFDIWYCKLLCWENTSWRTFFLRCPKKQDWLLCTLHIVCELNVPLWRSWRHLGLKMLEWSRWPTQPLKATTNVLPLLIVSDFVAGSIQCQVSKEKAQMEIQQNQLVEESGFQVQATGTSS